MDQKYCFSLWLIDFSDVKPRNIGGRLSIYWKKSQHVSRPVQFKPMLLNGQMYFLVNTAGHKVAYVTHS